MILRNGNLDVNVYDRSVRKRLTMVWERERTGLGDVHPIENGRPDDAKTTGEILPLGDGIRVRRSAAFTETLPIRHAGAGAVIGAVNALAAQSAAADTLAVMVLLPEGSEESLLRNVVDDIRNTCESVGGKISYFAGEVSGAVTRPVVSVTASGRTFAEHLQPCGAESTDLSADAGLDDAMKRRRGEASRTGGSEEGSRDCCDGTDILLLGHIGLEGTAILAEERREELEKRFPVQFVERAAGLREWLVMTEAVKVLTSLTAGGQRWNCPPEMQTTGSERKAPKRSDEMEANRLRHLINLSAGGIYAALWALAEESGKGFEVELTDIPILQETIEITDYYGINPYQLRSAGAMLAVIRDGEEMTEMLAEHGVYARVIGHLTDGRDKVICNGEERQSLNRPEADSIAGGLCSYNPANIRIEQGRKK